MFAINNNIFSCIGDKKQWNEYTATHEHCYELCKPLACVQKFLQDITLHGGISYALTVDMNSYSFESKQEFVAKHYPEIKKSRICIRRRRKNKHDKIYCDE